MKAIPDTLDHLKVPIDSVVPHPRNPRNGDIETIREQRLQAVEI